MDLWGVKIISVGHNSMLKAILPRRRPYVLVVVGDDGGGRGALAAINSCLEGQALLSSVNSVMVESRVPPGREVSIGTPPPGVK